MVEEKKLPVETNSFKEATEKVTERVKEEFERIGKHSTEGTLLQLRSLSIKADLTPEDVKAALPSLLAHVNELKITSLDDLKHLHDLVSSIDISPLGKGLDGTEKWQFRELKTTIVQFKTTLKTAMREISEQKELDVECISLKIQEVAKARFSHSTVAGSTAHGESVSLEALQKSITERGWSPQAPPLRVYRMPDGLLTSYDNRRLMVIKRIVAANAESPLQIPVVLFHYDKKHHEGDVQTQRIGLLKSIRFENDNKYNAIQPVEQFRKLLLEGGDAPFVPNTNLHYLFLRIYQDAGKNEALDRCTFEDLKGHKVIYGYHSVRVRD